MSENQYLGKPLAYLDQNILDLLVKKFNHDHEIYSYFKENFQVVYSDATLGEIYKAFLNSKNEKNIEKYLNVLEWLDANHIRIAYNRNFEFLNKCVISTFPVKEWFNRYIENKTEWGFLDSHIYNQFLLSYQKNLNINEIKQEALLAYENNLKIMENNKNDLSNHPLFKETSEAMYQHVNEQKKVYEQNVEFMLSKIMELAENDKITEVFRNEIDIFPKHLNNIEMPNVVQKIWNLYKDKEAYKNFGLDDFWNFKIIESMKERKLYNYEKVNIMYNMMNFIGFHQDTKLDQINGVQRAMSDFTHAQMASFCHFFFTHDKNLRRKIEAIYEYLDIPTRIGNINIIQEES
ncbi:hypothetical protein HX005_03535 [Acinetobacter sp. R933-2]|uniref:hypothetical protein n=1 Tax=Acinetobacter sp. R933-2 TaxID=2746728 RepID=UPI002577BD44|nr:hypothetical protein [Acinetobacter sp. R933-2]MDM1246462.1 hypothetical protein [Acinetobacter sp. R933-2]